MNEKFKNTFDQIHAREELKTSTMQFLQEERRKKTKKLVGKYKKPMARSGFRWVRAALVFCLLLVVIGGTAGYQYTIRPYAYISIDVNPSLELVLNKNDKIIGATAYNEDGEKILENLHIKGMIYTDAVEAIMTSDQMKKYLTDEYDVVIASACKGDKTYSQELEKHIMDFTENVEYLSTDLSEAQEAHSHHCSLGRYEAYKELSTYDTDITLDDCEEMSMEEIHDKVKKYKEDCDGESEETCDEESEEACEVESEEACDETSEGKCDDETDEECDDESDEKCDDNKKANTSLAAPDNKQNEDNHENKEEHEEHEDD